MKEPHLSEIALVVLAARRAPHPHIESCSWCREQYETLITMEDMEGEEDVEEPATAAAHSVNGNFRLAAQSNIETDSALILRQTWYLDEGKVLLRVFEEAPNGLVGYVICESERLHRLRVRFSGITDPFSLNADGSFRIGSSDIPIEPMTVTLEER
ncbi:MAG: hypothetical protein WBQ23_02650 [Bacteroidota bacterium]